MSVGSSGVGFMSGIVIALGGLFFFLGTVTAILGAPFIASIVVGFIGLVGCGLAGVFLDRRGFNKYRH